MPQPDRLVGFRALQEDLDRLLRALSLVLLARLLEALYRLSSRRFDRSSLEESKRRVFLPQLSDPLEDVLEPMSGAVDGPEPLGDLVDDLLLFLLFAHGVVSPLDVFLHGA